MQLRAGIRWLAALALIPVSLVTSPASAAAPAPNDTAKDDTAKDDAANENDPTPTSSPETPAPGSVDPDVRAADDSRRKQDLTPRPAVPTPPADEKIRFTVDPIGDGGVIVLGLTFGLLSSAILSTGEIRPQQISADFDPKQLLSIDRGAISQKIDPNSDARSNVGLGLIGAYALFDTVLDGFREGRTAAFVDAVMYVEAFTLTQGVTNLAKIAFRRPRPHAYIERNEYLARGGDPKTYDNASTDSALSFFSGHSSQAAALSAAATYIAFSRSPGTARPWLTLAGGAALTSFVAYERVRGGSHFPTDVIAGAVAGTAIGSLVVHLHRDDPTRQRSVWIGATPSGDGGVLSASGIF